MVTHKSLGRALIKHKNSLISVRRFEWPSCNVPFKNGILILKYYNYLILIISHKRLFITI